MRAILLTAMLVSAAPAFAQSDNQFADAYGAASAYLVTAHVCDRMTATSGAYPRAREEAAEAFRGLVPDFLPTIDAMTGNLNDTIEESDEATRAAAVAECAPSLADLSQKMKAHALAYRSAIGR